MNATRPVKQAVAIAVAVLVAGGAAVVGLASHGTSTGATAQPSGVPGAPGAAPDGGSGASSDFQQLESCLAEHGVTLQGARPDLGDSATREAFDACREYLPDHGHGGPHGARGAPGGARPDGAVPDNSAPDDTGTGTGAGDT